MVDAPDSPNQPSPSPEIPSEPAPSTEIPQETPGQDPESPKPEIPRQDPQRTEQPVPPREPDAPKQQQIKTRARITKPAKDLDIADRA
ncbi:hypothetical protein BH11MYX1_BH11MYX1_16580 [soil metagenome]